MFVNTINNLVVIIKTNLIYYFIYYFHLKK